MTDYTIGFIGGGNMASSLIGGMVPELLPAANVCVFDPSPDSQRRLADDYGIHICDDNQELIERSDVVVIALKPQVMQAVLSPLSDIINQQQPLLISVAAGIQCQHIENWLGQPQAVIRVMPNTPALVKAGASGLYANNRVSDEQKNIATMLLQSVGSVAWVEAEDDIDAVTALSGSGPAYFMLFVKSLIESGIAAGLDPEVARELAISTCNGAAALVRSSDESIQQLIDNVTSPGGTTEQALISFKNNQLPTIVDQAFNAALQRSKELAQELG